MKNIKKFNQTKLLLIIIMIVSLLFISIKIYNNEIGKRSKVRSNYYVQKLLGSNEYLDYIINDFKDITLYFPNLTYGELIGMLEKYEEENGIIFFPDIMFSPKADDNLIIIDPFMVNTGDFITIIDSNLDDKLSPTNMYVGYDAKKGLELEYLPNKSLLIDQIHSNDKRPEIVGNELTDRDLNKIAYFNILGDGSSYLFSTNEVRYTKFSELYKKYGLEVTFAIYQDKIYPVIKQSLLLDLEKTINVSKGFIGRVGTINGYIPTLIKEYKNDNKMFSDEDFYHFENSNMKNITTNAPN